MMKVLRPVAAFLFLTGCSDPASDAGSRNGGDDEGNAIGGETDIAMNTVGNVFSTNSVTLGTETLPVTASMTVLSNDDGVITAELNVTTSTLTQNTALAAIYDWILPQHKNASGNISTQLRFKSTSEGILDYANVDEQPHVLIRYDDSVGAEYSITKSSGRELTRTITAKSSVDDFPYNSMYIKTTTVESVLNAGGVKKAIYRANHHFGIVYLQLVMEDDSTVSTYLYSAL